MGCNPSINDGDFDVSSGGYRVCWFEGTFRRRPRGVGTQGWIDRNAAGACWGWWCGGVLGVGTGGGSAQKQRCGSGSGDVVASHPSPLIRLKMPRRCAASGMVAATARDSKRSSQLSVVGERVLM